MGTMIPLNIVDSRHLSKLGGKIANMALDGNNNSTVRDEIYTMTVIFRENLASIQTIHRQTVNHRPDGKYPVCVYVNVMIISSCM